jgi:23S rRNA (cytosine1962-C5)-methyltransferase
LAAFPAARPEDGVEEGQGSVHVGRADGGDIVRVVGPRGMTGGYALLSERSHITLRMLTIGEAPVTPATWRTRLEAAIAYRRRLDIDSNACRLVHGEADLLPSLVVDQYGDYLVVQALSQAVDRQLPAQVDKLGAILSPAGMLARHDTKVRELEGLDREVRLLAGHVPPRVSVREGRIEYEVDVWHGQKTGLFLDQRENRAAARPYASGNLLDCFSYHGGFALQLADRCDRVLALDVSEDAVAEIRRHAERNGLTNIEARAVNAFDELRRLERAGDRFDTIVLDPPAFAKRKDAVDRAYAGYKEINLRALKLLAPGGVLVTCSCSHHIDEAMFGQIVYDASVDARVRVVVMEKRMQSRDHPVLLGVPETYYLKCLMLRRLP